MEAYGSNIVNIELYLFYFEPQIIFELIEDHFHHQGQCVHEDVHEHLDGLRFKILSPDYL